MAIGIAIGVAVLIVLLVTTIVSRRIEKSREQEKAAAALLLKKTQLGDLLDMNKRQNNNREYLILVITWKEEKKRKYIFDPSVGVSIGRGREENQICIPLDTVSHKHCIIFSSGNDIYVQDLNSSNGTYIKRGFKIFRVTGCALCMENDTIIVGDIYFKIRTFYMDAANL